MGGFHLGSRSNASFMNERHLTESQASPRPPAAKLVKNNVPCRPCHGNQTPSFAWWRHQMETFSALLAIWAGNSPVAGEFPAQRPVTRSFDVFFDLRLNKRLSKQSRGWWFETPSCPLWRRCNGMYSAWLRCHQRQTMHVPIAMMLFRHTRLRDLAQLRLWLTQRKATSSSNAEGNTQHSHGQFSGNLSVRYQLWKKLHLTKNFGTWTVDRSSVTYLYAKCYQPGEFRWAVQHIPRLPGSLLPMNWVRPVTTRMLVRLPPVAPFNNNMVSF